MPVASTRPDQNPRAVASQSGPEGPWPTGARWRVFGVNLGHWFSAGGGGADPGESGCGFSASSRGAADLGRPPGEGGRGEGGARSGRAGGGCSLLVASAGAALWSVRLQSLPSGHPLLRCRWPSPACAAGVGVGATLHSAARSLMLPLQSPPLLRCPIRRRALAGALGTGQCAAVSCDLTCTQLSR